MALDVNVFDKIKQFPDYQRANEAFQMQKQLQQQQIQTGGIDAASKANIYATQVLSAATATGDQSAYDQARNNLQNNGIDVSNWAPDVKSAAQQAQAARLAQSPLGSLLNAGLKADANNIAATAAMGSTAAGQALDPLSRAVTSQILPGLGSAPQPAQPTVPAVSRAPMPQGAQDAAINDLYGEQPSTNPSQPVVLTRPSDQAAQIPKFSPPQQMAGETNQAYNQRVQTAFEAYKTDPAYLQAAKSAEETGTTGAKNIEMAKKADELTKRLEMNLNAMMDINKDVPESGFIPGNAKVYMDQGLAANGYGKGDQARAANQWDQINNQQILSEIQQFIASGGANTRTNQTLERIVRAASGINRNDLPASREAQINNALAEIRNKNVSAQNLAGGNQEYQPVPVQTSQSAVPKPGSTMQGTDGTYLFNGGDPAKPENWKKVN